MRRHKRAQGEPNWAKLRRKVTRWYREHALQGARSCGLKAVDG